MKKFKINNKEKIISIICPSLNGIEWIIVRNSEKEKEIIDKGFYEFDFNEFNKFLSLKELPNIIKEKISENIYISIPTNKVLLINNTYPTLKSSEINQIVKIQIDKISPYPADKLVYGNEIIENNDESSDVIMMGVHNDIISIAESYSTKKLNLLNIDCRVFSWIELMSGIIDDSSFQNQILIIDDSIDFVILFFKNKKIKLIRPLFLEIDKSDFITELSYEINYSLQSLGFKSNEFDKISIWNYSNWENTTIDEISKNTNIIVEQFNLEILGKITEGMLQRIGKKNIVNFLPNKIHEKQEQKIIFNKLKFYVISASILILIILLFFEINYGMRSNKLKKLNDYYSQILPQANIAIQNNKKLNTLKGYTDKSNSSLECIREITDLLPAGDIEFASFNYSNNRNITIRGSASNDDIVYEYFTELGKSKLFQTLKNQSINTRISNGQKRTIFSISLDLINKEINNENI